MDTDLPTKQQVTKKFIWGAVMIVASLVIGKLVLIPLIFYPGDNDLRLTMLVIYVFSWIMLVPGFLLAGIEGYRLVNHKYKELRTQTLHQMRERGVKAAGVVVKTGAIAAKGTAKAIKKGAELPMKATKTAAQTIKSKVPKKKDLRDLTFLSQK